MIAPMRKVPQLNKDISNRVIIAINWEKWTINWQVLKGEVLESLCELERQHREIPAIVSEISGLIENDFQNKMDTLHGLIATLTGKLKKYIWQWKTMRDS